MVQQTQEQYDLQDAIEALYGIFARYPLREYVESCPDCSFSDADEAKLHAAPLRELTGEQVDWYLWNAVTLWGNVNDFKHFLPRLLELVTKGEYPHNIEFLAHKMRYGDYPSWPEAERQAVAAFCMAWWRGLLAEFPTREWAIDALCLFALLLADLHPFLDLLRDTETLAARRHFFQVCDEVGDESICGPVTTWVWWCDVPDQARQVADWFFEAQTAYQLLRAIDALEEARWSDDVEQHQGWSERAQMMKDMAQTILKTA